LLLNLFILKKGEKKKEAEKNEWKQIWLS